MKLTCANSSDLLKKIHRLYKTAFPENERKPFFMFLWGRKQGKYDIIAIRSDDNEFLGLAIVIISEEFALMDYFAVCETKRGSGIGTRALKLIQKKYRDKKFLLEIESTKVSCENRSQRITRKNFYEHCGMKAMDYSVIWYGNELEILTYNCNVSFEDYLLIQYRTIPEKFADDISKVQ